MHERNVAQRYKPLIRSMRFKSDNLFSDCTVNNIMFDPSQMYPNGFHPVKINRKRNFKGDATAYTRTQYPPHYVLIDFGLSRQYPSRDVMDDSLRGGDKSAPEHQSQRPSNPFHTDIYYIGNLVRENFMMVCDSFSRSDR